MKGPRPGEVLKAVLRVRRELGLKTRVRPRIRGLYYDEEGNFLLIVVPDRPDKSAILGPGGRVLKAVRARLGLSGMAVRSHTDLMVKKARVREALGKVVRMVKKADGLLREGLNRITKLLRAELDYPPRKWPSFEPLGEPFMAVGFSGGVDSTALLYVAEKLGLEPVAITVDAGGWMIPEEVREWMKSVISRLGIKHVWLRGDEEVFGAVLEHARAGRRHPCRMCHEEIEREVLRAAVEMGLPAVAFGDLLPTGRFSAYWLRVKGQRLARLNLLASLALFKTDTILMAKMAGRPFKGLYFGCPLLKVVHREYKYMRLPSIQRVLREARAGILEPNQALDLIKSIIGR